MSPIKNYKVYNDRMKRAMYDKLFFVDKINPKHIVDFGCADGTLMREIAPYYPGVRIEGVDNDPEMRSRVTDFATFANLADVEVEEGSALILSSVLHEIYSYGTLEEITEFWKQARKFDYIVIRDMAVSSSHINNTMSKDYVARVFVEHPDQVKEFEGRWGPITKSQNFVHFLLKYKYLENWDREVKENYLPLSAEQLRTLSGADRNVLFDEHYVLPYLYELWRSDFGINVNIPTHIKLITKKA